MNPAGGQTHPRHWLVAHRGYPGRYPENSLSGMRAALEAGARFVEFDVQLSRDGEPVVVHDKHLGRVSGRDLKVTDTDYSSLARLSVSETTRFGQAFADERLPHLDAMLALLADWPEVTVFVELKRASMRRFGRAALVDPVMAALAGAANPCIPISFDARAMVMARERGAQTIGWVFKPWNEVARVEAARLAPEYLFVRADRVPEGKQPFWPGPWQWVIYEVDSLAQAQSLRERGAALIETDWLPDWLDQWASSHER